MKPETRAEAYFSGAQQPLAHQVSKVQKTAGRLNEAKEELTTVLKHVSATYSGGF
jgi:prefoldin subunit 5